ncbi:hypothetical protein Tco_1227025 [Tanacetum coccineum]
MLPPRQRNRDQRVALPCMVKGQHPLRGRGEAAPRCGLGQRLKWGSGQRPSPNDIFGAPNLLEDDTLEVVRHISKWEKDNYICRGNILDGMFDPLFDIYQNVESAKELLDSLEFKYMTKEASSKKFLVRIMQKSQENGQNRTNTNTGMDRVYKSWENAFKVNQSQLTK